MICQNLLIRLALAAALLATHPAVWAHMAMPDGMQMDMPMHVPQPVMGGRTRHSMARYTVPDIELQRDDGKRVSLPAEMNDGRPVIVSFIYTTCATICPMTSQTLSQLQTDLGKEHRRFHILSISIDPEQDTPARLRAYAKKFGAGPSWQHYTGSAAASIAAQRAFGVYWGDKMDHDQVVLMRAAPGKPWLRIEGFATPQELNQSFHQLVAKP